jgi:hypothetical protein
MVERCVIIELGDRALAQSFEIVAPCPAFRAYQEGTVPLSLSNGSFSSI